MRRPFLPGVSIGWLLKMLVVSAAFCLLFEADDHATPVAASE